MIVQYDHGSLLTKDILHNRFCMAELLQFSAFAIHDIMSPARYGDMKRFVNELRSQGYAEVRLIDTTSGLFMSFKEAKLLALQGSALLVGKK